MIAQNGVLTPESLSTGRGVAMPLKISFLQNKNISVVAKQCKKRISVPMSYMAGWDLTKFCFPLIIKNALVQSKIANKYFPLIIKNPLVQPKIAKFYFPLIIIWFEGLGL